MNRQQWTIGLTSFLTIGAIAGLAAANQAQLQVQSSPPNVFFEAQDLDRANQKQVPANPRRVAMPIDQHFIEMMIPHHEDAVAMANLAQTRAKKPELKALAQTIKRDQTREINQMRTWYKQWFGKAVPTIPAMGSRMGGPDRMDPGMMGSGKMGGPGRMGPGMMGMGHGQGMRMDLEALKTAPDFDREFVRQMIPHHQMAVHMAQMLQSRTTRPEMKTLAQDIIRTQTAEINQMQQW